MTIKSAETIIVESRVLNCDGGEGALGHPRVFLNMGGERNIDCPYCGRHFVLDAHAGADHGAH